MLQRSYDAQKKLTADTAGCDKVMLEGMVRTGQFPQTKLCIIVHTIQSSIAKGPLQR